jgi:ankyrin repeat protein
MRNGAGYSALMFAAQEENKNASKIAEYLIGHGADVNAHDEEGYSVLMAAAEMGHVDIVKMLLDKGAKKNAKDEEGNTALGYAEAEEHEEVIKLLK